MQPKLRKILAFLLCFLLCFEQTGFAQLAPSAGEGVAAQLDISGHLAGLRNAFAPDAFRPLHLRYLSYNPAGNNFQLFLDKGSLKNPSPRELEGTTKTLLNYFFVGITLPNDTFWVNLRPDSPDNIIDDSLAQTDVGRIMLEADVQLKKDTALATSPQTPQGKLYWDKLYKRAEELFGTEQITIPTLTRPWIVPGEIIIRETSGSAYIYKATLKVMLEEDYLKSTENRVQSTKYTFNDPRQKALNEYSSQLIRELIIPKLTKEINTSKRYASLRQVYYSLILAQWFKARFKNQPPSVIVRPTKSAESISNLIDSRNLTNLTSKQPWDKQAYFNEYQKSFKDGEYNIREPHSTAYGQAIRSYFSGGISGIAPNIPSFGAVTFIDPKTGASITSSPASGAISSIFRKGKKFLVPLLVSVATTTGVDSDTPLEFKVTTQEETPQITTPADSEIVTITTPKEIEEISQDDLIQIKLSSGTSYEFYRVKGTSVFYIEFGSVKLQNQALFRLSIFTESDTYSGKVLNDRQLSDVSEKREEVTGIGYDFRMEDICGFYTEAEKAGIALNELELKIKDDLLRFGFMEYRNRAYSPKQRIAIISCAQNSLPREDTVFHELRHGYYFSEPFVRESVMAIWNSIDSKQQVKIIKAVHMLAGYNSKNIDLILNELYASLLDLSSPLAGLVSGPDGQFPDVKLMQDLYSKFQKIEDEMHIKRVGKIMNDSIQNEMEKFLLEIIKNKSSSGQEEQSPENEDGSILGGDPKPPAASSPVVVGKEGGAKRKEGRETETSPNYGIPDINTQAASDKPFVSQNGETNDVSMQTKKKRGLSLLSSVIISGALSIFVLYRLLIEKGTFSYWFPYNTFFGKLEQEYLNDFISFPAWAAGTYLYSLAVGALRKSEARRLYMVEQEMKLFIRLVTFFAGSITTFVPEYYLSRENNLVLKGGHYYYDPIDNTVYLVTMVLSLWLVRYLAYPPSFKNKSMVSSNVENGNSPILGDGGRLAASSPVDISAKYGKISRKILFPLSGVVLKGREDSPYFLYRQDPLAGFKGAVEHRAFLSTSKISEEVLDLIISQHTNRSEYGTVLLNLAERLVFVWTYIKERLRGFNANEAREKALIVAMRNTRIKRDSVSFRIAPFIPSDEKFISDPRYVIERFGSIVSVLDFSLLQDEDGLTAERDMGPLRRNLKSIGVIKDSRQLTGHLDKLAENGVSQSLYFPEHRILGRNVPFEKFVKYIIVPQPLEAEVRNTLIGNDMDSWQDKILVVPIVKRDGLDFPLYQSGLDKIVELEKDNKEGEDKEPDQEFKARIEVILDEALFNPEGLLEALEKDLSLRALYSMPVGVWEGYTLREHTLMIMEQFEKYFGNVDLPGGVSKKSFRLMLALHDAGKPSAVISGDKDGQFRYTRQVIDELSPKLPFDHLDQSQIHVVRELITGGDPLGKYFKGQVGLGETIDLIKAMAGNIGVISIKDFFGLLTVYYQVDSGSYTADAGGKRSLDYLYEHDPGSSRFLFDNSKGRLRFSPPYESKFSVLEDAITKSALGQEQDTSGSPVVASPLESGDKGGIDFPNPNAPNISSSGSSSSPAAAGDQSGVGREEGKRAETPPSPSPLEQQAAESPVTTGASSLVEIRGINSAVPSLAKTRSFLKIAGLMALLAFIDPVQIARDDVLPVVSVIRDSGITIEYAVEIIQKAGWRIKVLSRQEWENSADLKGAAYYEGGAVVFPGAKVIYYGSRIPSAGHLAHETVHALQAPLTDQAIAGDYDTLESLLAGDSEAMNGFHQLRDAYTSTYNPAMTDAIKNSGELTPEEKELALRAVAAHETFSLIFGVLVAKTEPQKASVEYASCHLDDRAIMSLIDGIWRNPAAKGHLLRYYIKLGLDENRVNEVFSQADKAQAAQVNPQSASSPVVVKKEGGVGGEEGGRAEAPPNYFIDPFVDLQLRPDPLDLMGISEEDIISAGQRHNLPADLKNIQGYRHNLKQLLPYYRDMVEFLLSQYPDFHFIFLGRDAELLYDAMAVIAEGTSLEDKVMLLPFSARLYESKRGYYASREIAALLGQFIDMKAAVKGTKKYLIVDTGFVGSSIAWMNAVVRHNMGLEGKNILAGDINGSPLYGIVIRAEGYRYGFDQLNPRYPQFSLADHGKDFVFPARVNDNNPDLNYMVAAATQLMPKFMGHTDILVQKRVKGKNVVVPASSETTPKAYAGLVPLESVRFGSGASDSYVAVTADIYKQERQDWHASIDPVSATILQAEVVNYFYLLKNEMLKNAGINNPASRNNIDSVKKGSSPLGGIDGSSSSPAVAGEQGGAGREEGKRAETSPNSSLLLDGIKAEIVSRTNTSLRQIELIQIIGETPEQFESDLNREGLLARGISHDNIDSDLVDGFRPRRTEYTGGLSEPKVVNLGINWNPHRRRYPNAPVTLEMNQSLSFGNVVHNIGTFTSEPPDEFGFAVIVSDEIKQEEAYELKELVAEVWFHGSIPAGKFSGFIVHQSNLDQLQQILRRHPQHANKPIYVFRLKKETAESENRKTGDSSILSDGPEPPAASSPVVVGKEGGVGREEGEREEAPPNFTPAVTGTGRLNSSNAHIEEWLDNEHIDAGRLPVVVDFGSGIPPITSKELALQLGGKARVIGIDNLIPYCVVQEGYLYAMFNEEGGFVSGYDAATGTSLRTKDRDKMITLRGILSERGKNNDYQDGDGSITFNIHSKYSAGMRNLEFKKGDFGNLPLGEGSVDVIRIANVLRYYKGQEKEKIEQLSKVIREGGILIWHENSLFSQGNFRVYKKIRGELQLVEIGSTFELRLRDEPVHDQVDYGHNELLIPKDMSDALSLAWASVYRNNGKSLHGYTEPALREIVIKTLIQEGYDVYGDRGGNIVFRVGHNKELINRNDLSSASSAIEGKIGPLSNFYSTKFSTESFEKANKALLEGEVDTAIVEYYRFIAYLRSLGNLIGRMNNSSARITLSREIDLAALASYKNLKLAFQRKLKLQVQSNASYLFHGYSNFGAVVESGGISARHGDAGWRGGIGFYVTSFASYALVYAGLEDNLRTTSYQDGAQENDPALLMIRVDGVSENDIPRVNISEMRDEIVKRMSIRRYMPTSELFEEILQEWIGNAPLYRIISNNENEEDAEIFEGQGDEIIIRNPDLLRPDKIKIISLTDLLPDEVLKITKMNPIKPLSDNFVLRVQKDTFAWQKEANEDRVKIEGEPADSSPFAQEAHSASSPSIPDSEVGGIDFRSLPIVTQAVVGLSANISPLVIRDLVSVNLSEEWGRIEAMTSSGITPSPERIKEYVQTSCAQDSIAQNRDKLLLCISDILRSQEERCDPADVTLVDILVVLESISSARELRQVFLGDG